MYYTNNEKKKNEGNTEFNVNILRYERGNTKR